MTDVKELSKLLAQHRNLVKSSSIYLKTLNGKLRLSSAAGSGLTLVNWLPSDATIAAITVDASVLASFTKGTGDLSLTLKDERLLVKGKHLRGELPSISADTPSIPKTDKQQIDAADAQWLKETIPYVALSQLDKSGSLSVECIKGEWRISCTDSTYGACTFGTGASTIKFSLIPSDAMVLNSVLDSNKVQIGILDNRLVVATDSCIIAIPTIDGEAQTRQVVMEGTKVVAKLNGAELMAAIDTLKPFAAIKDSPPVVFQLSQGTLIVKASSAAGAIEHKLKADCNVELSIPLSFELLSNLVAKIGNNTVALRILMDTVESDGKKKKEVIRITLQTKFAQYLMLTSSV